MNNIFFYKLTNDSNGAPCVQGGLLSLAICKPMIRRSACEGDLIFGFAADSLRRDNALIYVARITKKLGDGQYYTDRKYTSRPDCIYRREGDRFVRRKSAKYHRARDLKHDIGKHPGYPRANVLLSRDFRYFGIAGNDEYKRRYPLLKCAVEHLKRGHRVRLTNEMRSELFKLAKWIWRNQRRKVLGGPTNAPQRGACLRGGTCCSA